MRSTCFILATLGLMAPANAEFAIVAPPTKETSANPAPPSPAQTSPQPKPHPKLPTPDPALTGFGDRIPLSFAVRQIVPAGFQVAFGETVDRDAPVDWKAGKPWRATLADAVRPLGLAVSMAGATVIIQPAASPP
jgi:hypothetical protein